MRASTFSFVELPCQLGESCHEVIGAVGVALMPVVGSARLGLWFLTGLLVAAVVVVASALLALATLLIVASASLSPIVVAGGVVSSLRCCCPLLVAPVRVLSVLFLIVLMGLGLANVQGDLTFWRVTGLGRCLGFSRLGEQGVRGGCRAAGLCLCFCKFLPILFGTGSIPLSAPAGIA